MQTKLCHIFLADDDEDDRKLFEEALEELTMKISFSSFDNGVELMDNLLNAKADLPDFIFLDLNMPLMDGEECLHDIRSIAAFVDIPVIIYSSSIELARAEQLQNMGANLYLKKPNSFPKLKIAIQNCIEYLKGGSNDAGRAPDFIVQL